MAEEEPKRRPAPANDEAGSDLSAPPRHDSLLRKVALSVAPPPMPPLAPGKKVGGRYQILRPLGAGGMGEVYLAHDVTLEREVAIKRHRSGRAVERLRREAIAMAKLAHPNVVTVFEVGELDASVGGGTYVAMEYVPGTTLRSYLDEPRSTREVLAMLRQIGLGLAAAHDAGIIHRDFKPENVLIGKDGRPRVSDFGLAREAGDGGRRGGGMAGVVAGAIQQETPREVRAAQRGDGGAGAAGRTPAKVALEPTVPATALLETVPATPGTPQTPPPELLGPGGKLAPIGMLGPTEKPAAVTPGQLADGSDARAIALAATLDERIGTPRPGEAAAGAGGMRAALTVAGSVMGTPGYMAPEQAAGRKVDARADQYAFCVVAWEALWGQRPAAGQPGLAAGDASASTSGDADGGAARKGATRGAVPRRVRAALLRGMAIDPKARHTDLRELLVELEERRPWRAIGGGAAALVIGGVAIWQLTGETPLSCETAGDEIAQLETPLLSQLHGGSTAGRAAAVHLDAQIDQLIRDYRSTAGMVCKARRDGGWSKDLYVRARGCLATQQHVAQGQLMRLMAPARHSAAPTSPTDHTSAELDPSAALSHALPLPHPAECADPTKLAGWPATTEAQLAAASSARAALALAEQALERRDAKKATAYVEAVARSPVATSAYAAPRLAMLRGLLAIDRGELDEGERFLAIARGEAATNGDAETELWATAAAIELAGEERRDRRAAEALITAALPRAEALGTRAPEAAVRVYLVASRVVLDERPGEAASESGDAAAAPSEEIESIAGRELSMRGADRALTWLAKAMSLLDENRPSPALIAVDLARAEAQLSIGRFGDLRADLQRALQRARALFGPDHPEVAATAATCASLLAVFPAARREQEACTADAERILALTPARPSPASARALRLLGEVKLDGGEAGNANAAGQAGATSAKEQLLAARRHLDELGVRDLERVTVDQALALAHLDAKEPALAVPLLEEAMAIQIERLGAEHVALGDSFYNLAVAERDRGNLAAADERAGRAISLFDQHRAVDRYLSAIGLGAQICNLAGDPACALEITAPALLRRNVTELTSLAWLRLERGRALLTPPRGGGKVPRAARTEAEQLLHEARQLYATMDLGDRVVEIERLLRLGVTPTP